MIDEERAAELRKGFPLLRDSTVAYLDNAATAQRAQCVMDAVDRFYRTANANPYRGVYELSEEATEAHEHARRTVAGFINASRPEEIIFTRNATEALNLAAYSLSELLLRPGDEVLVTVFEHHSNILPWQQAAKRTGAVLRYIECGQDGSVTEEAFRSALTPRTRIVSMAQVSTSSAGCTTSRRSRASPMRTAACSSATGRRASRTSRWTCRSWTSTSWRSPATRCTPPWASACSMGRSGTWRRCPRS
nr:aminotransferase class V-fold PLP-dependent enzyme [Candidatus Methanomethylophilus sp. 1R26]